MMNLSSEDTRGPASSNSNPRRPPAHLSVSLRHQSPSKKTSRGGRDHKVPVFKPAPARDLSEDNNNSGDSSSPSAQRWFDRSNNTPGHAFAQGLQDGESPYYLARNSSTESNDFEDAKHFNQRTGQSYTSKLRPGVMRAETNGSSADYRSVIDDLTIVNKRLRDKLRKHEQQYNAHLEKDRLFEVKTHGLSARKKRELDELLLKFASSLGDSTDEDSSQEPLQISKSVYPSVNVLPRPALKHSNSSSMSHPVDSAYASMSFAGPTSTTTLNRERCQDANSGLPSKSGQAQKFQNFLYNKPEGLMPKHASVMTERQKKKVVVQRLEQLFTGKNGLATTNDHSQPLQQQKVSRLAARADRATTNGPILMEGVREAHMISNIMDVDVSRPAKLSPNSSSDPQDSRDIFDESEEYPPVNNSPEQRPTRPLDLDPDRAQVPSENVEYIRHLGISTPQLHTEDSADAAADAQGWIYLNLLISMAQLHIINVTPDFVRSAVEDVSEKFQLSPDGKKMRWKGGSKGTNLSSDSGTSSLPNHSPHDRDSLEMGRGKRRKVEVGKFASMPIDVQSSRLPRKSSEANNSFHYKPLFNHHGSCSGLMSSDDSDSCGFEVAKPSHVTNTWSSSRAGSQGRRCDNGPIVFYTGAKFCTDLSFDRGNILPYGKLTAAAKATDEDDDTNSLNLEPQKSAVRNLPLVSRTTSGSVLTYRPFKRQNGLESDELRAKTPDLLNDCDSSAEEFFVHDLPESSGPATPLQVFGASGLGGTQPADHFVVRVETKRPRLGAHAARKLSKISEPGRGFKRFHHSIPMSSLESFRQPNVQNNEDIIIDRLASWTTFPTPPPQGQRLVVKDLPVQAQILSARFFPLEPSALPEPSGYYTTSSSSGSESERHTGTPSPGISHLRRHRPFAERPSASVSEHDKMDKTETLAKNEECSGSEEENSDGSEDDSDESIDMLATERALDPATVAAREREFELYASVTTPELPPRSSAATIAATVDEESDYESESSDDSN